MKFYLSQISQLFEGIKNHSIKSLLLYGPDKGYIEKIYKSLSEKFGLLNTYIEYSELKQQSLKTLVNSQNFFAQRELIIVRSTSETIDKNIKEALSKDSLHFLVFIADELSPHSTIRKLFEAEPFLAIVACYHDEPTKIAQIIRQKCNQAGKEISEDAVNYLTSYLKTDHLMIISEIEKLISYAFDKQRITMDDARCAVSEDYEGSGDVLFLHLALKVYDKFLQEFNQLIQYNVNEVLIIKALIKYYLKLYTVLCKLETDNNVDKAIKSLNPPIFYKYIPDFKKAVNLHNLDNCLIMLRHLQQAELDYKLNPSGFNIYNIISIRSFY